MSAAVSPKETHFSLKKYKGAQISMHVQTRRHTEVQRPVHTLELHKNPAMHFFSESNDKLTQWELGIAN